MNYVGISELKKRLAAKQRRVKQRYDYYAMHDSLHRAPTEIIPPEFYALTSVVGWCGKAVDSIADRVVFDGFANDGMDLGEIYALNSCDVLCSDAVLSALISSCAFINISADSSGYPRMQVIDGYNATGIIDPITHMLVEGYAVIDRDPTDRTPTTEIYLTAEYTDIYRRGEKDVERIPNLAPYPLLVPIINRPDAMRPFGRSRITRACMDYVQMARRTLLRSEVAAEFYSFPQKYVMGLTPEAEALDRWRATMSAFLDFRQGEDGSKPTVGQFQQQSMTPYTEQLRAIASMFAGETGLTLDDLGFSTANPSTEDSIRAAHENLKLTARKAQRDFAVGFINAGYLAACVRDGRSYSRMAVKDTSVQYLPIFEPDASTLSGVGDAIFKINQAAPGYLGEASLRKLTGLSGDV